MFREKATEKFIVQHSRPMNKTDLLQQEYFKLQDFYESFDTKAQTIKGWVAAGSVAAISVGFSDKNEFIWLLAAATCVVFWIMEAKWKIFQYCYTARIKMIEEAFRKNNFDSIQPLQIYSSWFKEWETGGYSVFSIMWLNVVMIPYLYTIITCLLLFALKKFHVCDFWISGK